MIIDTDVISFIYPRSFCRTYYFSDWL